MAPLEEGLRYFWMPHIHGVRGVPPNGLAKWLENRNYTFSSVASDKEFSVRPIFADELTSAFAHDSSRMACAAFETFLGIPDNRNLPRSCSWTNISSYYGAFFAAHSLLRMFGTACIQLEAAQVNALGKLAVALGTPAPSGFEKGFYIATYDKTSGDTHFVKSDASSKGSHGVLWETFEKHLRDFSNELIAKSAIYNDAALLLSDLSSTLCQSGLKGTWLSHVRNAVNYKQEFGTWFPYKKLTLDRKDLLAIARQWQKHPEKINLRCPDVLSQHMATSTAITSICLLVVNDMTAVGGIRSFHRYTSLALIQLAKQAA